MSNEVVQRKHSTSFDKKKGRTENDSASLELDLEHKDQDDACVAEFVPALQDVLRAREGLKPLRLEELSLRNNNLTTRSLKLLAPVLEAARFDIRDVDVSQNKICVTTAEDADAFATFLRAFRGCELVRRLDLSGNDFSGPLAMEVFLRVYCEQAPVDAILLYYETGPGKRDAEYDMLSVSTASLGIPPKTRADGSPGGVGVSTHSLNNFRILKRRRGLRAIPYIILKDVQLDDAGALHLSYVLEQHHWPQYLMAKLKDGSREAKRKEEDDANGCFGLVFSENPSLSTYGAKLLDYANSARAGLVGTQMSKSSPQSLWNDPLAVSNPSLRTSRTSLNSDNSDRRVSGASSNILSLRKRLQRTTIEKHGVQGVQLWHAAAKVLYAARVILPPTPTHGSEGDEVELTLRPAVVNGSTTPSVLGVTEESGLAAQLTAFPQPPKSRADSPLIELGPKCVASTKKPQTLIKIEKSFERDPRNPKTFPTWLWEKIFVEFAGGVNVLNDEQVNNIVKYARDRSNIVEEQQTQAKGESHQMWHVLEQLDCFTYELNTATR